jgi:hypothetical protein
MLPLGPWVAGVCRVVERVLCAGQTFGKLSNARIAEKNNAFFISNNDYGQCSLELLHRANSGQERKRGRQTFHFS